MATDRGVTVEGGAFQKFKDNISFVKEKISKNNAYFGVLSGFIVFFISLFFSWSQVRSGVDTSDVGSSTGWAESGYISIMPLLYILYLVIKDKKITVGRTIIMGSVSLILILVNNVSGRTTWIQRSGIFGVDKNNLGSDLGIGFWIGLFSLITIILCGISWAFHTEDSGESPK